MGQKGVETSSQTVEVAKDIARLAEKAHRTKSMKTLRKMKDFEALKLGGMAKVWPRWLQDGPKSAQN